jgi:ribonuclease VapC
VSKSVLDASALLALLKPEAGGQQVTAIIKEGAAISAVNFSEVVAKLQETGIPAPLIHTSLDNLQLEIVPFDRDLAYQAGLLRDQTRGYGLSFGDRACLALAQQLGVPAITADRAWARLSLDIPIHVIR